MKYLYSFGNIKALRTMQDYHNKSTSTFKHSNFFYNCNCYSSNTISDHIMAEAIVSVVLEQLVTVIGRQIQQEVKLVAGVDDEVKKLTSNFQIIQAVLVDAEQRHVTETAVRVWLEKLKDVSYDMDDVLDEWNTAILRRLQIEGAENARTPKRKVCSCFLFPYSGLKQVVLHHDIGFKIKAINENLDAIAIQKDMFNFKSMSIVLPQRVKSTSFVDVSEVFGRDEEKNTLVSKLLCESSERQNSLHIISIVGMGGIGKTTLAQLAYSNNEVMSNFEKRIWVCASDPFDELRIAKAINEALGGDNSKLVELESVLQEIHKSILEKKFLLVLDDVWTEDFNKWEPFHHCLKNGLHGSKVLITTRKQTSALIMKSMDIISIEELSNEHCWSLFSQLAFFDRSTKEREKLEEIGREIVSKCKGLPLAAKTIGSLLRFKRTKKEWENILYSEMWKLKEFEKGVFPPLLLSYYDLPSMVKRCFTYCAIFPKDFIFKKDELIKLWMAQSYLGLDQNEEIEIIGEEYFNSLAMRSFFQEFEKDDDDGSILRCKMHDIVHDVAQYLSKNECCMIEVKDFGEENINVLCEKALQLRLIVTGNNTIPISICNFKKLRSLLIECDSFVGSKLISSKVVTKLCDELTCLKALGIVGDSDELEPFKHIPKEIGRLIHLRYLDLSYNSKLRKLPETLCELYNLQTLKLDRCEGLEELPQGIGKLINLRHLMTRGTNSLRYMPKGIERLTRLRTLTEFHSHGDVYGGKACPLECLNNFRHLESIGINMDWSDSKIGYRLNIVTMNDEAILETFRPSRNLRQLEIVNFKGSTMSTLRRMTSLTNLRSLELRRCNVCEHLPPLGKLPSLETLVIWRMDSVREVGNEFLGVESGEASSSSSSIIYFPNLKTLRFYFMEEWEVWDFGNEDDTCTIMPSLRSLELSECPKLKGLPKQLLHQMAPLQHLEIEDCPILQRHYEKGKGDKWQDISHIPNINIRSWGWIQAN